MALFCLPSGSITRLILASIICSLFFPRPTTSFGIIPLSTTTSSSYYSTSLRLAPFESSYLALSSNSTKLLDTALAIVPPLPDWDRLQRARHFARDALFHQWPPAIRLFHPFQGTALEVAQAIEELQLEPFELTFDTWVIVPNLEAVEEAWRTASLTPHVEETEYYDARQAEEDEEVRKLIEREERIGLEKAKAREAKRSSSNNRHDLEEEDVDVEDKEEFNDNNNNNNNPRDFREDLSRTFRRQQQQLDDFGGPSILCLEPNPESKQVLQELRDELAVLLNHEPDYFSPSSIYSYKYIMEPMFRPDEYRPLIPIGAFDSLQAALQVARRLKGLWGDPLSFEVKELHILSCRDEEADPYLGEEWTSEPWGCNAKVMLVGEEEEHNDVDVTKQIDLLLDRGQAGGNDISNDYTILEDEEEISDLEMWLNNDDDFDEGMQVVIGRTHFYTGDQRSYKGMPASSVMDARDKSLGDVGAVSGLARRRRTNTRSGNNQWEDGEYGRRQSDYVPWTKREKPKKVERLLDFPAMYDTSWKDDKGPKRVDDDDDE